MGLLDDAIREHLELKRRHGADPGEVSRQEHEALGPARREPAPAPVEDEHDEPVLDELGEAPGWDATPEPEALDEPVAPEALEPAPEPVLEDEPEPEPAPRPRLRRRREVPDHLDQPTVEHPAARPAPEPEPELPEPDFSLPEPEPEPEPQPRARRREQRADDEDGDVLEGTPEFLEETPEHDRLWFEQRPPRDFDFDD
jgi:hypothetical protein